jgi:peptidoglycan/LPS O-acetylase OafA/YrhL
MADVVPAAIERTRNIPSLDGLRALSIVLVMMMHTLLRNRLYNRIPLWERMFGNGEYGVLIFFVMSGYLITTLLLREREATNRIRLGNFYIRRGFRILPALYVYILFVGLLGLLGRMPGMNGRELVTALTFTRNYIPNNGLWAFEHLWSLCVEEQFYLIWPVLLIFCTLHRKGAEGRNGAARVALGVLVAEPFVRLLSFRYLPNFHNPGAFHMIADGLMFGALGALQQGHKRFETVYASVTRWPWLLPMVLFFGNGFLSVRFGRYWDFPLGITVGGFLILMWMLWLVRNPTSIQGRVMNQRAVRWIGRLSYSLYLWQTFFLHHLNVEVFGRNGWWSYFPASWMCILVVAAVSFYCIEQPALRMRDMVLRRNRSRG